jgi:hypothetical protein
VLAGGGGITVTGGMFDTGLVVVLMTFKSEIVTGGALYVNQQGSL